MKNKQYISAVLSISGIDNNTIKNRLQELSSYLNETFEKFEIVIVDNTGGKGKLENTVKKFKNELYGDISIVRLPWKHRKEYAIQAGLDTAIGDFVYEIHHFGVEYELNIFKELFEVVKEGNDIVSAIPEKSPLSNKVFYKFLNIFSHLPFDIGTETIILSSRRALNNALKHKQRTWQRKIMYKFSGFDTGLVTFKAPPSFKSDDTLGEKTRIALDLLFSFTNLGFTIPIAFAVIFMVFSIFIGIYTVYVYLFFDSIVEGWTTQMLFLSVAFSGLFLILGFISRYMGIILSEVHQSSNYTVKDITHIEK